MNDTERVITVCDPRYNRDYPRDVKEMPKIDREGFMYWFGELREVQEVYHTARGTQIQLF